MASVKFLPFGLMPKASLFSRHSRNFSLCLSFLRQFSLTLPNIPETSSLTLLINFFQKLLRFRFVSSQQKLALKRFWREMLFLPLSSSVLGLISTFTCATRWLLVNFAPIYFRSHISRHAFSIIHFQCLEAWLASCEDDFKLLQPVSFPSGSTEIPTVLS